MKVRFVGLSFEPKSIISIDDLMNHIINKKDQKYPAGEHYRIMRVNKAYSDKYYVGVVITVKDQKKFCELANDGDSLKIIVKDIEDDHNIMDFNFFVLNKTNGFCLYQHYHHSCSAPQFGFLLSNTHTSLRMSKVQAEIESQDAISESKKKFINKKYAGRMEWQLLVRKDKLKDILLELERIKSFEFDFLTLEAKEKQFQPLSGLISKSRERFSFTPKASVASIANGITDTIDIFKLKKGRIIGEDENGIQRVISILDNPDNYGEYEYDEVASRLDSLTLEAFESSWIIEELINKCSEFKHMFEVEAK